MTDDGYDEAVSKPDQFVRNFRLATTWKTTNMCCFDTEFTIRKFNSIGDILEAFVAQRLPAYEARRLKQLEQLQAILTELEAKRAFLTAVLEGRLVLMHRTDEQIVGDLKTVGIPPLTKPDTPDSIDSYEFVLKMRIDRVKASAVEALDKEIDTLRGRRAAYERDTPAAMWLSDLGEFETVWKRCLEIRTAEGVTSASSAAAHSKKGKAVKRVVKSGEAKSVVAKSGEAKSEAKRNVVVNE